MPITATASAAPRTNYRTRLVSRDPDERAAARAEIEQKGKNADNDLLAELDFLAKSESNRMPWILLLTQIPNWLNLSRYRWGKILVLLLCMAVLALVVSVIHHRRRHPSGMRSPRLVLALLLAERNDLRAIGPLLEIVRFAPTPRPDADAERAAAELARLLARHRADPNASEFTAEFRKLTLTRVGALYPTGRRGRARQARAAAGSDFSEAQADLLASLIQVIGGWASDDAHALLTRIAEAPTGNKPNREFVRDAARAFLDPRPEESGPNVAAPSQYALRTVPVALPLRRN